MWLLRPPRDVATDLNRAKNIAPKISKPFLAQKFDEIFLISGSMQLILNVISLVELAPRHLRFLCTKYLLLSGWNPSCFGLDTCVRVGRGSFGRRLKIQFFNTTTPGQNTEG